MKVKLMILWCSMVIIFIITAPVFAQPSITTGIGPPYNGFAVDNSDAIIFEFTCNPDTDGDVDIPMLLPASGSAFTIIKNNLPCPLNSPAGCFGSTMMYPTSDMGSFTVSGGALSTFNVEVFAPVSPGTGFWEIDPPTNAAIQYIRTIPAINVTYPAEVLSGEAGIAIDASATAPLYVGTISPIPSISTHTWTQTSGPEITLTGPTTLTPTFDAPTVTVDTNLVFQLSVTDNAGLTATEMITVRVLAPNKPVDIILTPNSVDENADPGFVVGALSAEDIDQAGGHIFILTDGNGINDADNDSFIISGENLIINTSPDYETKDEYYIYVRATDDDSQTFDKALIVYVNDIDENNTTVSNIITKEELQLLKIYPNPSTYTATIAYSLPENSDVEINLYDLTGRKVQTLFKGHQNTGEHALDIESNNIAAGTYFYKLEAGTYKSIGNCIVTH